jgi:hypothetical protein
MCDILVNSWQCALPNEISIANIRYPNMTNWMLFTETDLAICTHCRTVNQSAPLSFSARIPVFITHTTCYTL